MSHRRSGTLFGLALLIAIALAPASEAAAAPVPEIPNYALPDIAMARWTARGPVIVYNPRRCAEVGSLVCSWYRAHEYGHIALRTSNEARADCWAARHASPAANRAAFEHFMRRNDWHPRYGHARDRARRIASCSRR